MIESVGAGESERERVSQGDAFRLRGGRIPTSMPVKRFIERTFFMEALLAS